MLRQIAESFRLFLDLFQDLPPLPRRTFLPGVVLLLAYPLLSVLLGTGEEGQAFVTAFLLAMAVRIGLRFEDVARPLMRPGRQLRTAVLLLAVALLPLALLAAADELRWCQRLPSFYFLLCGGLYLSDMLAGRTALARRFWPQPEMQGHLAAMTRFMVLFSLSFVLLNETMIRSLDPSHWLLFWAVLPVLSHTVLAALRETVLGLEDDRDTAV